MAPKDSFFKKFVSLRKYSKLYEKKERFGIRNPETIGLLLVSKINKENYHKSSLMRCSIKSYCEKIRKTHRKASAMKWNGFYIITAPS